MTIEREGLNIHKGNDFFDPDSDLPFVQPGPGPSISYQNHGMPIFDDDLTPPGEQFQRIQPRPNLVFDESKTTGKILAISNRLYHTNDNLIQKIRVFKELKTALKELEDEIAADKAELLKELE